MPPLDAFFAFKRARVLFDILSALDAVWRQSPDE